MDRRARTAAGAARSAPLIGAEIPQGSGPQPPGRNPPRSRRSCETIALQPIVARRSGFSEAKQLSQVFRALVGVTPTSYRANFRLPDKGPVDGNAVELEESK